MLTIFIGTISHSECGKLISHLMDHMKSHPIRGFAKLPDCMHQKIVSYLEAKDLLKVGSVSRQTRTWLEENCDKSLMREGHQERRMVILNLKFGEEAFLLPPPMGSFMLNLVDIFEYGGWTTIEVD